MDRYVRSLWAAVVGSWFIPPLAGRTGVYSRWFFHIGARRWSRRGNPGQTASHLGRFFGKPQNDTNGAILAAVGSGFSIGSRMTRTRTYSTSDSHPHVILSHSEGSSTKRWSHLGSLFAPFRMTPPFVIARNEVTRQSRAMDNVTGLPRRLGRLAMTGSGFSIGSRMTRIRTWTRTLLPSPSIRKLVVIGLAALLVATTLVPILNFIQPNQVQAAWYNEDWTFRKGITVTHGSDEANVYTTVEMDTSDTSRFKNDCSDLRFTDYNGTVIPYHIVSGCGTSETEVQLLFGTLPQGEQTVYVYYGNESASDVRVRDSFNNEATGVTATLGTEESSQGPVAAWKFDEGYGTTAHDSANTHNGTISGATWQSEEMCPSGKCLRFDGAPNGISVPNSDKLNFTNGFTLSAWIKLNALPAPVYNSTSGNFNIIAKQIWPNTGYRLFINGGGGNQLTLEIGSGSSAQSVKGEATRFTSADLNEWKHVAVSYSSERITLYINGKEKVSTASVITSLANTSSILAIGRHSNGGEYFNGSIDEPKAYNYARSQQQIQQDYVTGMQSLNQQQANLSNGLVGYWKMDESSWDGATGEVKDASGNGNDGQAVNGTAVGGGKFGNGGSFDGVDDYVHLDSQITLGSSLTYSFWLNADTGITGQLDVIGCSGAQVYVQTNGISAGYCGNPASQFTVASTLGEWRFVTVVFDGFSSRKIYINGNLSGTNTAIVSGNTAVGDIGARSLSDTRKYEGLLDEFRIYNRALTSTEVQQLYSYAPKPVAYYDFEEGSGGSVFDKSGNGHTGTWSGTGSRYVNGRVGKAGFFNGSDASIDVTGKTILSNVAAYTVTFWIKAEVQPSNWRRIISTPGYSSPGDDEPHIFFTSDGTNGLYGRLGGTNDAWVTSSGSLVDLTNKWEHVAITIDASGQQISYINGNLSSTITKTGHDAISLDTLFIGSNGTGGYFLKGLLDEVKMYNYVRTPGQIVQDMQAGQLAADSPLGYWKFDEGQGTVAHDFSGLNNTGTLSCVGADCILPQWQDGINGTSLYFDGTNASHNSMVVVDYSGVHAMNDLTISGWIKPSSAYADASAGTFIRLGGGTDQEYKLAYRPAVQAISFYWYDGAFKRADAPANSIPFDTWSQITVVRKGLQVFFYSRGQLLSTSPVTLPINQAATSLTFGRTYGTGVNEDYSGSIDELKVYNSALTPQDILVDYNQSSGSVVGSTSTESTTSGTGQSATKPSNSAGNKYCVPGSTEFCAKPVGEWEFEEGSGAATKDTSINGNNGTLFEAVWSNGKYGSGVDFSKSSTSYIQPVSHLSDLIGDNQSFTVEAWVYPSSTGSTQGIIGSGNINGNGVNPLYITASGAIGYYMYGIGGNVAESKIVSKESWHHGVMAYDALREEISFYVDGQMVSTKAVPGGIFSWSAYGLVIGNTVWKTTAFSGSMDQVIVYNYTRTPTQVAWDYNYGKPIAQYKFDECSGSTIHDSSEHGLDGVLSLGSGGTTTVGNCENATGAWGMAKSGKYNSAMSFDGVDDAVTIANSGNVLNLTRNYSLSVWVKSSNYVGIRSVLAKRTVNSASPYVIQISNHLVQYHFYGQDSAWHSYLVDSNNECRLVENEWSHIAVTFSLDNNLVGVYVNSRLCGGGSNSVAPINTNNENLSIGRDYAYPGIEGQIDDVQLFNYALTDTQIKTLYNGGAVRWGQ